MTTIRLISKNGELFYPETVLDQYGEPSPIVLCVYPQGDCDSISWPRPNMKNLQRALFNDRECGLFDDADVIELPNGEAVGL